MEGLARLEYRGYDSAGVALVDGDGTSRPRKRAGKLANLARRRSRPHPLPGVDAPASGTPAGPPTAAPPTRNAHPHLAATTASSR